MMMMAPQLVRDGPTRTEVLEEEYFFRAEGRSDSRRIEGRSDDIGHPKLELSVRIYNLSRRSIQTATGPGFIPYWVFEKSYGCLLESFLIDPRQFVDLSHMDLVPDAQSLSEQVFTELVRQHAERVDPARVEKLVVYITIEVYIIYPQWALRREAAVKLAIGRLSTKLVVEEKADDLDECPICAEGYVVGQTMASLPCLHTYHTDCIQKWLQRKPTCPYCRADFGS